MSRQEKKLQPGFEIKRELDRFYWILRGKSGVPLAMSYKGYGTRLSAIRASDNVADAVNANLMERVRQLEDMKGVKWNN